jgi:SagB-type dehydrogenase family enzyme
MRLRTLLFLTVPLVSLAIAAAVGYTQLAAAAEMSQGPEITLPAPSLTGGMSLEEALAKRRSVRSFTEGKLTLDQIGQLAWAAQGITDEHGHRTAPSAMAVYPLTVYAVVGEGAFRYVPQGHKLARISERDVRALLSTQGSVRTAPLDIVIAADFALARARFGERAERFVSIEAGHIAQNVLLQAVALGLGAVPVGGYQEDGVREALGLRAEETPLYVIPVGHPKPR